MMSRWKSSGDPPETPPRGVFGKMGYVTGKSRQKFQKIFFFLNFEKFGWNYQLFSQNIRRPPGDPPRRVSGGSPDNFRRDNIAGSHDKLSIYKRTVVIRKVDQNNSPISKLRHRNGAPACHKLNYLNIWFSFLFKNFVFLFNCVRGSFLFFQSILKVLFGTDWIELSVL